MRPNNGDQVRRKLINMTSHIIATEGFGGATTKNIASKCGMSEVYIYRVFDDKNDLFRQMFLDNDINLKTVLLRALPILREDSVCFKERLRNYYGIALDLMLSVPDDAVTYLRFFYSTYYEKLAKEEHENCYRQVISELSSFFKDGVDTAFLFRYVFESILATVYNISIGDMKLTPELRDRIFEMCYCLVMPFIRDEYINGTL